MSVLVKAYQPDANEPYMSRRQRDFFRGLLLAWRERLLRENLSSRQRIRSNDDNGGDLIDRSVKDSHRALDFIAGRRTGVIIAQIDAALKRIEEGTYGYCLESGEEIGIDRLSAYPVATLSVEAQELRERLRRQRQPGFGH